MLSSEKGKGDKWSSGSRFRISDYDEVINRVSNNSDEVIKDLLNYDMCNQCFRAIKDILIIQREDIDNPIPKSYLSSYRMKKLFDIVIGRKERNKS